MLRISHDKDLSRNKLHLSPLSRLPAGSLGEIKENFILDRIGVLKLVDQDRLILALQLLADPRVVADEIPGADQESVERDEPLMNKNLAEFFDKRAEEVREEIG